VLLLAAGLRFWRLGEIPSTINGDEIGSIVHPWQFILGQIQGFTLTHDLSVPALVYIPKVLMQNILGMENALIAARVATGIFSLLGLLMFYHVLRKDVSLFAALMAVLLFSFSYWHMHFSRISWIAVDSLFWGLLLYALLRHAIENRLPGYGLLAGVVAAIVAMNYMGGWIFLFAGGFYALSKMRKPDRRLVQTLVVCAATFTIVFSPMLKTLLTQTGKYSSRASSRSIFNLKAPYYGLEVDDVQGILRHQLEYAARGFLLFDGEVSNEWTENKRLIPPETPAVNILVQGLFYIGLIIALRRRKGYFFILVYIFNFILLQLMSVYIPSWSRAIAVLPVLYYFASIGIDEISRLGARLEERVRWVLPSLVLLSVMTAAVYDGKVYWDWIQSETFTKAQRPAIEVSESAQWMRKQYEWVAAGNWPFTIYEWQGGWRLSVLRSARTEWVVWDHEKLLADEHWVVVYADVWSLREGNISLYPDDFILTTPALEEEISLSLDATLAAGSFEGCESTVADRDGMQVREGEMTRIVLAFEVPDTIGAATLQAKNGMTFRVENLEYMILLGQ
jgi:hypothetical protein